MSGAISFFLALHFADLVYDGWLYDSAHSLAVVVEPSASGPRVNLSIPAEKMFEWDAVDKTYFRVAGSRHGLIASNAALPPPPADTQSYREAALFDATVDGRPVRVAALNLPAERFGESVQVEYAETENKRDALARAILLTTLIPQLLLIAIAALVIWFGVRRAMAPMNALAERLTAYDNHQLPPIPPSEVPQEVRPLVRALDSLLSRLDAMLLARHQFLADIAHQLRTPLTAIKLHLAETRRQSDPLAVAHGYAQLERAVDRASRLSRQLLVLARTEPKAAPPESFAPVNLRELAEEVGGTWVPLALRKNLELSLSSTEKAVFVRGQRELLYEALDNLIDNAVKYHPGGGNIRLYVHGGAQPQLVVEDDGPGIASELRSRIVERHYRGSYAVEGNGLGLAIVKKIVDMHNANLVVISSANDAGLRVTIEFASDNSLQS